MPHPRVAVLPALTLLLASHICSVRAQRTFSEPEDWQYFPSMAAITSASESHEGIYFSTLDGVIFFDYFTGQLSLEPEINMGLPSRRLHQVYYDVTTNALWVVHDEGIAFRMPTDDWWRFVPFTALPDNFRGRAVARVGGSFDGIWIDMYGVYTQLNAFTGDFMRRDIVYPDNPVTWNVSRSGFLDPPSLMGWFTTGEWSTSINEFLGPGFMTAVPLFVIRDRDDQVWFGTDLGVLFRGDTFTKQLVALQAGIVPKPVITIFLDGNRVWFADNAFRRQGTQPASRGGYFLSSFDEEVSTWRHYSSLASEAIRDVGVNDMLRVGRHLWLATMNGIVLLDTKTDEWAAIGANAGLRDRAIWDMERHGQEVFVATYRGIDIINPATHRVVPQDSLSSPSPLTEVYALHSTGDLLYAGTADGIYEYNQDSAIKWRRVSSLPAISLWGTGEDMYVVANNLVFHHGPDDRDFELMPIPHIGEAKILEISGYGSYIWLATSQGAVIQDRKGTRQFIFNRQEGLPSDVVYAVVPTARWVWFLTKEGVVRFNWSAYFD